MKLFDAQQKPVPLGPVLGHGGEATVYKVDGQPFMLAKVFEPAPRANYLAKLSWMIAHPPENPTEAIHHPSLAWPSDLLYDKNRKLAGYLMPLIQGAVPALDVFNPRRRALMLPRFDQRYLYRAARNLAAALGALHLSGYVMGDLNESNVLVTPSALVTLIDTDSFQVTEQSGGKFIIHYCPVGKPEYTPPELQARSLVEVTRLPEHDNFALAVLIFQLLMGGSHPFRAQWLGSGDPPMIEERIRMGLFPYMQPPPGPVRPPKIAPNLNSLHPSITELFRACFIGGHKDPRSRPTARDWRAAVADAEKALVLCQKGHYFSSHLFLCPICQSRPVSASPFPVGSRREPDSRSGPASRSRGEKRADPLEQTTPMSVASSPSNNSTVRTAPRNSGTASKAAAQANPASGFYGAPASSSRPASTGYSPAGQSAQQARRQPSQRSSPFTGRRPFGQPTPPRPRPAPNFNLKQSQKGWLQGWVQPRVAKSFMVGGSIGALAGVLPGALVGFTGWSVGHIAAWYLLWGLGGAAAGILRGWQPSYRVALWIRRYIGWQRLWEIVGGILGGIIGTLVGLLFWWAVIPVFVGLIGGIKVGARFGRKVWLSGYNYGWERIGAGAGALILAVLGGVTASLAGNSLLGTAANQSTISLASWLLAHEADWTLIWLVTGAVSGAFGGAIAGIFSDLLARLSGLVD